MYSVVVRGGKEKQLQVCVTANSSNRDEGNELK